MKPQALLFLTMMAGWMNRQQQRVIEYLVEENRVLREQLDIHAKGKRIRFNAGQRRRLAEKGRRWKKTVSDEGILQRTHLFLYDDWNCIREVITDHKVSPEPDDTWARNYVWGLDLSGSLQGAGGVGGLLQITLDDPHRPPFAFFPCYDGNGNVLALIRDDGELAATYDYGPFGEQLRADGPWADMCPFRFSTKYQDTETGLNYYGHRYYSTGLGRWLSRDPIEEQGGINLLAATGNDSINRIDYLGLCKV